MATEESSLALIKATQQRIPVSQRALKELRRLIRYNDGQGLASSKRVSAEKAISLLRSYQVKCGGRASLDRICRERFKRTSYGTP